MKGGTQSDDVLSRSPENTIHPNYPDVELLDILENITFKERRNGTVFAFKSNGQICLNSKNISELVKKVHDQHGTNWKEHLRSRSSMTVPVSLSAEIQPLQPDIDSDYEPSSSTDSDSD